MTSLSKLEKVLIGLEIFKKYNQFDISTGDDCIFAGNNVSEDDHERLIELDWIWMDTLDCWMIFV